jgi:hypothetical protein
MRDEGRRSWLLLDLVTGLDLSEKKLF